MGRSILIIDAQSEFVDPLAHFLRAEGIDTMVTGDGKVGLARAEREAPDAIVVCVELPQMSGYSICARLRKDEELKGVPLVVTSGVKETQDGFEEHKQLRTRADEYLKKPFSGAQLLDVLAVHLPRESQGATPKAKNQLPPGLPSRDTLDLDLLDPPVHAPSSVARESLAVRETKPPRPPAQASDPPSSARAVLALKQALADRDRDVLDLREKLQKAERDLLARRDEEMDLERRVVQAEEERENARDTHGGSEKKIAGAMSKIAQLELSVRELRRVSDESAAEASGLKALLADKETALSSLNASLDGLRKQSSAKETEIIRLSDERFAALSEVKDMTAEVKDMTARIGATEVTREKADAEASKLRVILEKMRHWASAEINTLKAKLAESEKIVGVQQEALADLRSQGQRHAADIERLQSELSVSASRAHTLEKELARVEERAKEAERAKQSTKENLEKAMALLEAAYRGVQSEAPQGVVRKER